MKHKSEIRQFLEKHLQAIFNSNLEIYKATTAEELTLYEWYITPHRIDGLAFHEFMIQEASRQETTSAALVPEGSQSQQKPRTQFDLANYSEQLYQDTAIVTYTMLISQGTSVGVKVFSYNETRVIIKLPQGFRVVHVHKSPTWKAPFQAP